MISGMGSPRRGLRRALALTVAMAVVLAGCSDAYTEEQRERDDTGTNPDFVSLYTVTALEPAISELTDLYELIEPTASFLVAANPDGASPEDIAETSRPVLWVDTPEAQAPYVEGAAAPPVSLGEDELVFIVPRNNPAKVSSLRVFGPEASEATSILCVESELCGRAARHLLELKGVEAVPDLDANTGVNLVKFVVAQRAQAGLAYRTDAVDAGDLVEYLPIPSEDPGQIAFQLLQLEPSAQAAAFAAWVSTAPEAQDVLRRYGYLPPADAPTEPTGP